MTHEEEIANLELRLAAVNHSISEKQAALDASEDADASAVLSAQISQLQQTMETLETALNNLRTPVVPLVMSGGPTAG